MCTEEYKQIRYKHKYTCTHTYIHACRSLWRLLLCRYGRGSLGWFIASNIKHGHFDYLVCLLNAGCTPCSGIITVWTVSTVDVAASRAGDAGSAGRAGSDHLCFWTSALKNAMMKKERK